MPEKCNQNNICRPHIAIIGGGASGMIAAIFAARSVGGEHVLVIEKNDRLGRKILATGNGRCNFTNLNCSGLALLSESEEPFHIKTFCTESLEEFGLTETLQFFEELGILAREEEEGRIYPYSEQATAVQEALVAELERLGVRIQYNSSAASIKRILMRSDSRRRHQNGGEGFDIVLEDGRHIAARKIIIAVGGKAGIQYGSSGEGYKMARSLGHTVIKTIPALVQITTEDKAFKQLKGVRSKVSVDLITGKDQVIASETGEIQFTEDGLSGICIFNLTRYLRRGVDSHFVRIDFFPDLNIDQLEDKLNQRVQFLKDRKKEEFLNGLLNKKLAPVILEKAGIEATEGRIDELKQKELSGLCKVLKSWKVPVAGTKGWKEAQVTSGGIDTREINDRTMGSKLVPNLYFAGEVMDVDGKCGGYNLQWAWTSGAIAGKSAGRISMDSHKS